MSKIPKKEKILAVIVTHNQKGFVEEMYLSLLKQTYSSLEIIVINNGSTDGTKKMLIDLDINSIDQDNLGAASGWFAGLEFAVKGYYDYCWLMDDDGYADSEALGRLLRNFGKDISCCASTVLQEKNKDYFVFPYPKLNKNNLPKIFDFNRKFYTLNQINKAVNYNYYPFAHFFNGTLIKVSAIKIGDIQKNFVIYGEELDLFYRLRDFGKVITVLDAYHYHPNVKKDLILIRKFFFIFEIVYLLITSIWINLH